MKLRIVVLLAVVLMVAACSQHTAPPMPFEKTSAKYEFFKNLSATAPLLDPDNQVELVSTKSFSIYTGHVMPFVYPRLKAMFDRSPEQLTEASIKGLIDNAAVYMAEKEMLVREAKNSDVNVSDDTLQAEINNIYEQNGGEEKFKSILEERGLAFDYFLKDVEESLYIRMYLNNVLFPSVDPSDTELQEKYDQGKSASVRHILLTTTGKTDEEKQEALEKIEGILKRARDGEDFAELAKEYTEDPGSKENGGLYEDFTRGRMVKPFEDAAFSVPVGEISDVVETNYGYHIIKVINRKPYDKPFDEVKDELKQMLSGPARKQAQQDLLTRLKEENNYKELFAEENK